MRASGATAGCDAVRQQEQEEGLSGAELCLWLSTAAALPSAFLSQLCEPTAGGDPTGGDSQPEAGGLRSSLHAFIGGDWQDAIRQCSILRTTLKDHGWTSDRSIIEAAAIAVENVSNGYEHASPLHQLEVLTAGAAALMIFAQANFAGPPGHNIPSISELMSQSGAGSLADSSHQSDSRWAESKLEVDGEELIGRIAVPQYLLLARALIVDSLHLKTCASLTNEDSKTAQSIRAPCSTWIVWALRVSSTHQRILSKRTASLRAEHQILDACLIHTWGDLKFAESQVSTIQKREGLQWPWIAKLLVGCCRMELAAIADLFGAIAAAAAHMECAAMVMGVELELTGVLGTRTVHQKDQKAQMVARVHSSTVLQDVAKLEKSHLEQDAFRKSESIHGPGHVAHGLEESEDMEDVLDMPHFEGREVLLQMKDLSSVEQVLLLRAAIHEKKKEAGDAELKHWRMAPFVETVLRQAHHVPAVATAAQLLRSRHESCRTRTKQRAFLRFTKLIEETLGAKASPLRVVLAFSTPLPSLPALRKEYGELMVSLGLVGEAMKIFEELELWNSLITCYTFMEKKLQAAELIRRRLEVHPDDHKLLCALGDCTGDEQCYHDAWEKSGKRSARAMRSLADAAHRKKCFAEAAQYWEAALALNPLHASGWFALGHCHLKQEHNDKAVQAFTRCCQLEPDNGASWNNIAALCLAQKKYKEAFHALSESSKYMQQNWHTWDNLVQVAVLTDNWSAAVTSLQHMVQLRGGNDLPMEAISSLVLHLENLGESGQKGSHVLQSRLHGLLKDIAASGPKDARFWVIYARLHAINQELTAQRECLIKATRAMLSAPWQKSKEKFEELADALGSLVDVTVSAVDAGTIGSKELAQLRMQLRGTVKQAEERFEDQPAMEKLLANLTLVASRERESNESNSAEGRTHASIGALVREAGRT